MNSCPSPPGNAYKKAVIAFSVAPRRTAGFPEASNFAKCCLYVTVNCGEPVHVPPGRADTISKDRRTACV